MKIGILGGGQLAQMMMQSPFGSQHEYLIYTSSASTPTEGMAPQMIHSYDDETALKTFAEVVDVITFETETIPVATVNYVKQFTKAYPSEQSLYYFQDRLFEKNLFKEIDIPTNHFVAIDTKADLDVAAKQLGFPFIIKSRRDGYDGKHQWRVKSEMDLDTLKAKEDLHNCIAEEFIAYDREVSIIGVRASTGEMKFYDLCENLHVDGILNYTQSKLDDPLQHAAEGYLRKAAEKLDHVGVMTIEFFVKDKQLLANEVAPRVHNSGHWTIEGAETSQFDNHIRAICGEALGSTRAKGYALMYNFIGDLAKKEALLALGMVFHDYKKSARPKRKLAHCTLVSDTPETIQQAIKKIIA